MIIDDLDGFPIFLLNMYSLPSTLRAKTIIYEAEKLFILSANLKPVYSLKGLSPVSALFMRA